MVQLTEREMGKNRHSAPLLVVAGPTAAGKTDLLFKVAELLPLELVNADSMQVYRGLDIGTAKPDMKTLDRLPHHLLGILDIDQKLTVHDYLKMADAAITDIAGRGRLPVLCGGSGMYVRAALYGLDPLPADESLQGELRKKYSSRNGIRELREIMRSENPADLERWGENPRRMIRAYEVFILTGKPMCELQRAWERETRYRTLAWRLEWEREKLRERIAERTRKMLESGWIEEAASLIEKGLLETPTARQALGYSDIAAYLDGQLGMQELFEKICTSTWQLARRQQTWFRNKHPEMQALQMPTDPAALAREIEHFVKNGNGTGKK